MRIVFLASAQRDLAWFRKYYENVFPEGAAGARREYLRILSVLKDNPRIGRPAESDGNRELVVPRTPFLLLYRLANGRIEVIHLRDGRAAGQARP